MVFSSLTFLFIFLPSVFVAYYLIPNRIYRNFVLLVFSLLFYSWGEPLYIILMIVSTLTSYFGGLLINNFHNRGNFKLKHFFFWLTTFIMLGLLFYFKYSNFLVDNMNNIFGTNINHVEVSLPIGISFYTFQALSYVVDLYWGNCKVQKNYFSLLLYVSLFPQLIAGPIVRYTTVENEITNRKENVQEINEGIHRFISGLSKKVLIANNVALITNTIYEGHEAYYGSGVYWLAILAYAIQIYFDFSGYSDMAIGLGKMFGFHFEENFNYPYSAHSITEFWRRWHISLSSFFRDYLYIPLGGSRVKNGRLVINLIVVWLLTGLWHGASWNFILWGLYYGLILIFEKIILFKFLKEPPKVLGNIYTIFLVLIGWVIFESFTLEDISFRMSQMFNFSTTNWSTFFINNTEMVFGYIALIFGVIFSFPVYRCIKKNIKIPNFVFNIFSIIFLLLSIISIISSTFNPFIYFRF